VAVAVSGTGYGDYEAVDVYVDTTDTLLLATSSTGTMSGSVTIPASASPGTHYVTAVGRKTGTAVQKDFTVTTPWAQVGFGYAHQRANPFENTLTTSNIANAGTLWTNTTPASGATVAVVGTRAYISTLTGVEAVSTSTGKQIWKAITGSPFYASPTVLAGVVYVGSSSKTMYALNATTGATIWSRQMNASVLSSATVVNGTLYFGCADGKVYALNASTGGPIYWSFATQGIVQSTPTVVDGVLYVGATDDKVYALNATTGATIWSYTTGGQIVSSPAVYDGVVYVGSGDGKVYALSARGMPGNLLWSYQTDYTVDESPAVYGNTVFIGASSGYYLACA
jgi:outer membrane protein assembly factor BamB